MTRAPRLLVIDPSIRYAEQEGAAEILRGWPGSSIVLRPALDPGAGPRPDEPFDVDGIVLMGSRASATDEWPWLKDLSAWLHPILDGTRRTPLLGICFGHQLIAHLAGGRIGPAREDGGTVRGAVETTMEGGRLIPGRQTLMVAVSHREAVLEPPRGYVVTARRADSPSDALEHPDLPVFGVQFHPEAREQFLARRGVDLPAADPRFLVDGQRVLSAFREFVLSIRARMQR